jgi:hypothetical protein
LVKKLIAFNGTLNFIAELTKTHRLTLSWTSWIQLILFSFFLIIWFEWEHISA